MASRLMDWLDNRTGIRKFIGLMLIEDIPGGAKWRYVWGSTLAFVFAIQLITGICLMTAYSPSATSAWESVYFIQYEMDFGWLIRGLHHFGSQTMVVLLAVHMLQVVIAGAHLAPREINWWLGLALLGAVLGLSLTGYLLPWDQKGYSATQVATKIAGNLPVAGPFIQKIAVGGPEYGHHTVTRFFALHVGVLPALVIVLVVAHVCVFRRHGITHPKNAQGEGWFWPDQAFKDLIACLLIFAVMVGLVLWGHGAKLEPTGNDQQSFYQSWAHKGREGLGANLDAPADPSRSYPARPEWYFLFLFQLLKHFEGEQEVIGTVAIPGAAGLLLFVLPLLGYGRMRWFGHVFGTLVVIGMIGGAMTLIGMAVRDDHFDKSFALKYLGVTEEEFDAKDPKLPADKLQAMPDNERIAVERNERARLFHQELRQSEQLAARAIQLASGGIPADGAIHLLRRDPQTMGPKKFTQYCGGCHNHSAIGWTKADKASDLAGWGTEEWNLAFLKNPRDKRFLGHTGFTDMAEWVDGLKPPKDAEEAKEKKAREEKVALIPTVARWLASKPVSASPQAKTPQYQAGFKAFNETVACTECHRFEGKGNGSAPDLAGYGSADWLRAMILSPEHDLRYGKNNKMPAFRDLNVPEAQLIKQQYVKRPTPLINLDAVDRELIIRWLTGDGRVVFGGEPIPTN